MKCLGFFEAMEENGEDQLKRFKQTYEKGREIGSGASSVVFLGEERATQELVAIKEVKMETLLKNQSLMKEVELLSSVSHQGIVQLVDVFQTCEGLMMVMELVKGPELFDLICERRVFSEFDTAKIIRQLSEVLSYLHSRGVVHHDLKPENILVVDDGYDCDGGSLEVKLIDFGLSSSSGSSSAAGTLGYKPPELIQQHHRQHQDQGEGDMWALGVISYILLHGFPPFFSEEEHNQEKFKQNLPFWVFFNTETERLRRRVCEGEVGFDEGVSEEGRDFVGRLLEKDPSQRMTAREALLHPWLGKH